MLSFVPMQNGREKYAYVSCRLWYGPTVFIHRTTSSWSSYWNKCNSYVYWTVHHLDSWIIRDQRDVSCFIISLFNAQHVSDVNTSILRSLRLICWVISWVVLLWFDECRCYVVVWLWWCGIRMRAGAYRYHTTTAKPQSNTDTHQTTAIQPMK